MVRSSLGLLAQAGRGFARPIEQQSSKSVQNKGRDFFREVLGFKMLGDQSSFASGALFTLLIV